MSNKENSKIESVESFTSNQEIIDYFENEDWDVDYLESLLTLDLLKNKEFQRFVVSKGGENLAAFDYMHVELDIFMLAHDSLEYQTDRDIVLWNLSSEFINDEFVSEFNFFGSSIYQIIDKADNQNLQNNSIKTLVEIFINEVNENTMERNLCTYGNDDSYYHWVECLTWKSFSNLIGKESLLNNQDIVSLLFELKAVLQEHFIMLKQENILDILSAPHFEETPQDIMDDWLNGLEKIINEYG